MQLAATSEWLYRKGMLSTNEFLAGEVYALLIEWRHTCFLPKDSTALLARKFILGRPLQKSRWNTS